MRRDARTDGNHSAVITAFRKCGVSVLSLAPLGGGVPDLLCACANGMWLVEVKDGSLPPSQRKLNDLQVEWHSKWPQKVFVVTDAAQVPEIVIQACRA